MQRFKFENNNALSCIVCLCVSGILYHLVLFSWKVWIWRWEDNFVCSPCARFNNGKFQMWKRLFCVPSISLFVYSGSPLFYFFYGYGVIKLRVFSNLCLRFFRPIFLTIFSNGTDFIIYCPLYIPLYSLLLCLQSCFMTLYFSFYFYQVSKLKSFSRLKTKGEGIPVLLLHFSSRKLEYKWIWISLCSSFCSNEDCTFFQWKAWMWWW